MFTRQATTRGLPDDHEGPVRVIEIPGESSIKKKLQCFIGISITEKNIVLYHHI